jgi:hypothetical protein
MPLTQMEPISAAVITSIARLAHHYAWMKYSEIRKGIPSDLIPISSSGKRAILSALEVLEADGYVHRKGSLWGFTVDYQSFRNNGQYTQKSD